MKHFMSLVLSLSALFGSLTVSTSAHALELAVMGDAGFWNTNTRSVRDSMVRAGVKGLVMPGDNLYEGAFSTYEKTWKPWKDNGFTFEVTAIGNHTAGYAKEVSFFNMGGEYYSKTLDACCRFIVLNSDNSKTASLQAKFLEKELALAIEPSVFVVYHHPSRSLSSFHSYEEKRTFQNLVLPILFQHREKISALLVGHDHLALVASFNDLPVILSGATHEIRHDAPVSGMQDGVIVKTNWYFQPAPTWVRMKSQGSKSTFEFIRAADDRVQAIASIETGKPVKVEVLK